eukprot:316624_1
MNLKQKAAQLLTNQLIFNARYILKSAFEMENSNYDKLSENMILLMDTMITNNDNYSIAHYFHTLAMEKAVNEERHDLETFLESCKPNNCNLTKPVRSLIGQKP